MTEQLLIDVIPFQYQILEEGDGSKRMKVKGVFQREGVQNENGRIYPNGLFGKKLKEQKVRDRLDNRGMFGELDHPSSGKTSLQRVSHIITGVDIQDDGTIIGEAEILDTPNGKILQELFKGGTRVGISSRGTGSLGRDKPIVQDDYKLETWDFVANPSTAGAFPAVLSESIEFSPVEAVSKLEEISNYLKGLDLEDLEEKETAELVEMSLKLEEHRCALMSIENTDGLDAEGTKDVVSILREEISQANELIQPKIPYGTEECKNISEGGNTMPKEKENGTLDNKVINENVELLQEQMAAIVEDKSTLNEIQGKYNASVAVIDEMKNRFREMAESYNALEEELGASEAIIEELTTRLEERVEEGSAEVAEGLEEQEKQIESLSEYAEQLEGALEDITEKYNASVDVLESVLEKGNEAQITSYLEGILEDHPHAEFLKPILEQCQSQEEMVQTLNLLEGYREALGSPVVSGRGMDLEPLPTGGSRYLYEGQEGDGDSLDFNEDDESWLMEDVQDNSSAVLARKVIKKHGWR